MRGERAQAMFERGLGVVLGLVAAQEGVALPARGNGANHHVLAYRIAVNAGADFGVDADRLMADRAAGVNRILAFQDMDIGAANGGRGDFHDHAAGAGNRYRLVGQLDHSDVMRGQPEFAQCAAFDLDQ